MFGTCIQSCGAPVSQRVRMCELYGYKNVFLNIIFEYSYARMTLPLANRSLIRQNSGAAGSAKRRVNPFGMGNTGLSPDFLQQCKQVLGDLLRGFQHQLVAGLFQHVELRAWQPLV